MAQICYGEYARHKYDLGVQEDLVIPEDIRPLRGQCSSDGTNELVMTLNAPDKGDLRIVLRQFADGKPLRSSGGAPPHGVTLGNLLRLEAWQDQRSRPVVRHDDKAIWSGLSWAVGEVRRGDLDAGRPVRIRATSRATEPVELQLECYAVTYRGSAGRH